MTEKDTTTEALDRRLREMELQRDKDSFNSLTSGLTENWVIIVAIISGVFWIFQSINGVQTVNLNQDNKMDTIVNQQEINTEAINSLTSIVDSLDNNQSSIERDISEINNNISEIKESLNDRN